MLYLNNEGDPSWLVSLENTPKKLQQLSTFNNLLAHRPWALNKENIRQLINFEDPWTLRELVYVILLMALFHSLSSFSIGCGIVPEIDTNGGTVDESLGIKKCRL